MAASVLFAALRRRRTSRVDYDTRRHAGKHWNEDGRRIPRCAKPAVGGLSGSAQHGFGKQLGESVCRGWVIVIIVYDKIELSPWTDIMKVSFNDTKGNASCVADNHPCGQSSCDDPNRPLTFRSANRFVIFLLYAWRPYRRMASRTVGPQHASPSGIVRRASAPPISFFWARFRSRWRWSPTPSAPRVFRQGFRLPQCLGDPLQNRAPHGRPAILRHR